MQNWQNTSLSKSVKIQTWVNYTQPFYFQNTILLNNIDGTCVHLKCHQIAGDIAIPSSLRQETYIGSLPMPASARCHWISFEVSHSSSGTRANPTYFLSYYKIGLASANQMVPLCSHFASISYKVKTPIHLGEAFFTSSAGLVLVQSFW